MHARPALAVAFAAIVSLAPTLVAPARAATAAVTVASTPTDAVAVAPKVVIVVGETEATTATYRTMADSIATEALKWTPNVVKVYSPYATWSAVVAAAQGASIFVYLGHGNGFPSPYSTTLQPTTQDGLGLNKVAGGGDVSTNKQYYGESYLASTIHLAASAIVFLNHLCYAPGAGEPGAPEPSVAVAEQRVDDYASGFIRAGARAVMADDYSGTVEASIRAIFSTHQPFLTAWRSLVSAHNHEIAFVPPRNPAFQAIVDPETATTGFDRSIVTDANLTTDDIVAGAGMAPTGVAPATLTAPGAASVTQAGLPVDADATLTSQSSTTLAAGTKLRVNQIVALAPAADGTLPPPAVQVATLDGTTTGWVSGGGLAPADSASPRLWAMTGTTTISPNFDGVNDRLNLWGRLSEAASWSWSLSDPGGNVLRTQSGSTDLLALSWDALPGGLPAPAGTYHWALHAVDAWGNPALDTGGDVTVVSLPVPPTAVAAFTSVSGAYSNAASVSFRLTLTSPVTGLVAADLTLAGTATGCVIGVPSGSGTTWDVAVGGCSEGTVGLTLAAASVTGPTGALGPAAPVNSALVLIDRTNPSTSAPSVGFRGVTLVSGSTTLPVAVSWTASDTGSGLASYDIARSVDGGSFLVLLSGLASPLVTTGLASGHTYRFEVRPHDRAGNVGAWVAGPTLSPVLVQQTTTAAGWSGTWTTWLSTAYSGGSARTATAASASVTYSFTGRAIAVAMSRDPAYGQVRVYVDGVLVGTVDTRASTHQNRVVVFTRGVPLGSHTIKLVVVGTAGRPRVVVDAFEVIR